MIIPTEHAEQVTYVQWFRCEYPGVLIHAIPNGGHRSKQVAQKLKMEGVVPGVPDLFIPELRLFVEMKRRKGGSLSKDQKILIEYLESVGYFVIIGKGFEDAKDKTLDFTSSLDYDT